RLPLLGATRPPTSISQLTPEVAEERSVLGELRLCPLRTSEKLSLGTILRSLILLQLADRSTELGFEIRDRPVHQILIVGAAGFIWNVAGALAERIDTWLRP
ncbi:MAG TPA: hypothetical protein VJJ24_01900, partial [Candidatus Paceibacterota bacterium]